MNQNSSSEVAVNLVDNYVDQHLDQKEEFSNDSFKIISKIALGRNSEIFEGIDLKTNETCIIKIFTNYEKSVQVMIERQIKILKHLENGPNIVKLQQVFDNLDKKAIILQFCGNCNLNSCCEKLTDMEIRFYMRELLNSIEYCHSMGIIHRNLKPKNVLIDQMNKKLTLISWGMAEFHRDGVKLKCNLGTRYFKSPELLLNVQMYDYSIDMWNLGCIFAKLIFGKEPFSPGRDNFDQLVKMVKVLGSEPLFEYLKRNSIETPSCLENLEHYQQCTWNSFVKEDRQDLANDLALDFLDKLLRYDPKERMTAKQALCHPYLTIFNTNDLL